MKPASQSTESSMPIHTTTTTPPSVESSVRTITSTEHVGLQDVTQDENLLRHHQRQFYLSLRRAVEVAAVLVAAPVVAPICALIALAIRIDSEGPVFFVQNRKGYKTIYFGMVKFRTMRPNSDGKLTRKQDSRITRVGAFLRNHRLDELPQLWNVLTGDMSFVGPRPQPDSAVQLFANIKGYEKRYDAVPGITGWAQVKGLGYWPDEDVTPSLESDYYYVDNFSFKLDMQIVFKTIAVMFGKKGAR